jgi:hypothetical protein
MQSSRDRASIRGFADVIVVSSGGINLDCNIARSLARVLDH